MNQTASLPINLATAPKADCRAEAERCLNRAVELEGEGKSAKMLDLMLDKAVKAENAANDGRA